MILPYKYISHPEDRDEAISHLLSCSIIGVDVEGDSLYHYQDKVCLIQISGNDRHYIFDPLLLDTVAPLSTLFKNEKILKVLHGSEYDLISLRRGFGFTLMPLFDTVLAARAIGMKLFSLQNLVVHYFNIQLEKAHQKADWSKRPIPAGQLEYAYKDTLYLSGLYERLMLEVKQKGRLDQIEEECLLLQERVWEEKPFSPDNYLKIKGAKDLLVDSQKILRELLITREEAAKQLDRPPFKVISSEDLLLMAKEKPHSLEDLKKIFQKPTASVYRNPVHWLKAVSKGERSDEPLPAKPKKKGTPPTPEQEKRFLELKKWRDARAIEEDVESSMVISTDTLRALSVRDFQNIDQLSESGLLRQWQIRRYGQQFIPKTS
jgi:ribonuclease D